MARQIGFHFYSFKIWQKYTSELETLSSLRKRQDALPLLLGGLHTLIGRQMNDQAAKRMGCLKRIDSEGRHLTGILEAGHYGESANIVQSRTGQVSHRQQSSESAMMPCFFRLVLPMNQERGVMILQRDNRVPAKQVLTNALQGVIHQFDNLLTCDLIPIANKATFERLIRDGEVQEVRFIKLSIPQDFAAAYDRGRDETEGSVEVSYRARRGASLPIMNTLRGWLRGGADILDQYEIPGLDFDFDTVKADIRVGKKVQSIDFGRRLTQPIIDVTDQVDFEPLSGHPTYESLLSVTAELADDDAFTAYGE